jgi:transposase
MPFAPNAPEQNPVEEVWLAGKNHLRRHFAIHKTFAQVKNSFSNFLQTLRLESAKFAWYAPYPQLI